MRKKFPAIRKQLISALSLVPEDGCTVEDLESCVKYLESVLLAIETVLALCYEEKG